MAETYKAQLEERRINVQDVHSMAIKLGMDISPMAVRKYIQNDFKKMENYGGNIDNIPQIKSIVEEMISNHDSLVSNLQDKFKNK